MPNCLQDCILRKNALYSLLYCGVFTNSNLLIKIYSGINALIRVLVGRREYALVITDMCVSRVLSVNRR